MGKGYTAERGRTPVYQSSLRIPLGDDGEPQINEQGLK